MEPHDLCPRALSTRDAGALIGVLAVLTGESMLGQLDDDLGDALTRKLVREGLVTTPASPHDLQAALGDLVERLRFALGEYDDPPVPGNPSVNG